MTTNRFINVKWSCWLLLLVFLGGCAELEKEKLTRVVVTGNAAVAENEELSLSAATENGSDASYVWASANEAIATVDAMGTVTGRAVGETTISATGADSKASGDHPVVVTEHTPTLPYYDQWLSSAHADPSAEAFGHWDLEDPAEVPTECARCHSSSGYRDYLGDDGSAVGSVDAPAPIGSVIDCAACHNTAAQKLSNVVFPSGVEVTGLGSEARCMTCHQGRASTDSVNASIANALADGEGDADTPNADLKFENIHYYAAGATLFAGRVRGGYQYEGKSYDWRFRHVPGKETCIGCHDPHSLKVRLDSCATCHERVKSNTDLKDIRMIASKGQDYDGDGNRSEGMYYEVEGLRELLLTALQAYPALHDLDAICYNTAAYPYWFIDSNGDGKCSSDEASFANQYKSFTPRLVRSAYNYQVASKDPGAFAHNAKYIIQLLYDSVEDLGTSVSLAQAVRTDTGHFNGASEAARHWDSDEEVSSSCSKCHGASEGFRFFQEYGVGTTVVEPDNGLDCATCHTNPGVSYETLAVTSVLYPSGKVVGDADTMSNLCSTCHAGREAKATIDAKIATGSFGFRNVHYLPAGAIRKGHLAEVGYEYTGKTYAGFGSNHAAIGGGANCTFCHNPVATNHSFAAQDTFAAPGGCGVTCHAGLDSVAAIRVIHTLDYDNDGNIAEPLAEEVATLADAVLARMQVVAAQAGPSLCYKGDRYPYFFTDTNGNGSCEAGESSGFNGWTPALMKAAHNFQISQKEPGAWAHNFNYIAELLIDSIENLGGDVSSYLRP